MASPSPVAASGIPTASGCSRPWSDPVRSCGRSITAAPPTSTGSARRWSASQRSGEDPGWGGGGHRVRALHLSRLAASNRRLCSGSRSTGSPSVWSRWFWTNPSTARRSAERSRPGSVPACARSYASPRSKGFVALARSRAPLDRGRRERRDELARGGRAAGGTAALGARYGTGHGHQRGQPHSRCSCRAAGPGHLRPLGAHGVPGAGGLCRTVEKKALGWKEPMHDQPNCPDEAER